jgi:hypothetical protein
VDRLKVVTIATTIAAVAVEDMRTLIGLAGLLAMKTVSVIMAVILVMSMHHLVASTVTLRRDARTVMVAAMTDVVDTMREMLVAPISMPIQGWAREMLVKEEALTAEVEFMKIVLPMIDTPVDNCDR